MEKNQQDIIIRYNGQLVVVEWTPEQSGPESNVNKEVHSPDLVLHHQMQYDVNTMNISFLNVIRRECNPHILSPTDRAKTIWWWIVQPRGFVRHSLVFFVHDYAATHLRENTGDFPKLEVSGWWIQKIHTQTK